MSYFIRILTFFLLFNLCFQLSTAQYITTFAGTGAHYDGGDGGQATAASFSCIYSFVRDIHNNIYISDPCGWKIRKIDSNGIVSTIAGTGIGGHNIDGAPASTSMLINFNLASDNNGNVYIADSFRYVKKNKHIRYNKYYRW